MKKVSEILTSHHLKIVQRLNQEVSLEKTPLVMATPKRSYALCLILLKGAKIKIKKKMAQDERLNQRIRKALKGKRNIEEKSLFGGLCFMHRGNMFCGCDLKHGLSVRVGPKHYERTLKLKHARKMDLTGIPLKGFVFVDPKGYETHASLKKWLERGLSFTQTLPPKKKTAKKLTKKRT